MIDVHSGMLFSLVKESTSGTLRESETVGHTEWRKGKRPHNRT